MMSFTVCIQEDFNQIILNLVFNGELEPVVLLLGWIGSNDKVLAKYSLIYEKEGCITIRYIHPTRATFLTGIYITHLVIFFMVSTDLSSQIQEHKVSQRKLD